MFPSEKTDPATASPQPTRVHGLEAVEDGGGGGGGAAAGAGAGAAPETRDGFAFAFFLAIWESVSLT